jgi:hypothetical protein
MPRRQNSQEQANGRKPSQQTPHAVSVGRRSAPTAASDTLCTPRFDALLSSKFRKFVRHFAFSADSQGEMANSRYKLSPELVEAIARRVVEILEERGLQQRVLVDAAELARRLGVERSWIYTHAIELGAVKLGEGPKARLRFDPEIAARVLRKVGEGPAAAPPARSGERAGQPPGRRGSEIPLLPVRGRGKAGPHPAA